MKNIVNRALVAKKKQFQSKSVPRGTRTIWRYLGALFILFTFAIGNVWAADPDVEFTMSTSTNGDYFKNYTVGTNTVTISTSASSISSGNGGYYIDLGSNSSVFSTNYLGVKVTGGATISKVEILASGSGNNKSITAPVVGWKEGWDGSGTTADAGLTLSYTTPGSNGSKFSTAKWREANVASWGATEVRIYKKLSSVTVTDYTLPTTAETVRVWGVRVYLSTGGTTTTYTVTLNPGEGAAYSSAPTGWTADGNNIKKTVSAGALTIPEPTRAGYKVTGWKSGLVDVALSAGKLTVSKDTSLTAQWAEAECKIYSLTGGIGSAEIVADESNASISAESLVLKGSSAIIKLTPAAGETFKAGDVVTISGTVGNTERNFGVKISNTNDKKATLGTISVAGNTVPMIASGALTGNADYLYLVRDGGTTQTMLTFEVHRACAEGAAAGLSYANATVNKLTTDAAFTNALTNANGLVIAGYTSSNAEVATVDKNGQVTLVGAGEATITAHSAIQTKAGTLYAAGTASYTLTVATPQTFEVTYAANGGEGTMTDANTYLEGAEVTLLDNTFTPPTNKIFGSWVATYNDGTEKTLTITNGKFTMPAYDVTVTAQWVDDNKVAKIGETYYTSLEGAEGAFANVADGQTIELLKNCDVTSQLEIAAGVTATIDLNGYTIEYTGSTTLTSGVILVHNGASLTINDSNDPSAGSIVSGDKAYAAVALTKLGDDASNPATLVVNGGALTGYYYGITGNGSRNNTDITINGGAITGTVGIAIYHPQVGTLTVNNGTLTGVDAAIEMRAGTLVINDGTFTATATVFSCDPNGSGSTTTGAAIAIAQHTTKKEISVTINGGTFNGVKALNESNPQVNDPAPQVTMAVTAGTFTGEVTTVDVNNFISGGTFDHEVAANQCAEGYAPKDNGDNTYGVKPLAQTFSLEDLVTAQGTGANYTTYLNNLGWTVANEDALDNLNTDKDYDNYPYLGLKFKNATGYVAGEVEGGKLLTIKLGHMAGVAHLMVDDVKKMELDGVDAETPKVHYYYVENTANVKLLMANAGSKQTCVLKAITVADPFTVTFDANGGEAVASLNGTPSVTLPLPVKGTESFLGWFDGETKVGMNGEKYTPTANITLVAHWEAVSTDARLASISFSSDAGTLSPAFDPEVTNYTYTMPYGTASVPTITGATSVNANAQAPVIGTAATAWGEAQTVKGVAQSGAEKIYTVTMLRAPKDGVCIIKGNVGNNTFVIDEDASLFAGTADKNNVRENSSTYQEKIGWKFQARPARLGLTLSGDETFQAGDVVEVFVTSVANIESANDKMRIFDANEATAAHLLYESEADMVQGVNRIVLPATTTKSLYLHRTKDADYDNFNPYVAYVAVYRPMMPELTAITINGEAAVKGEGNTFAVTLPEEGTNFAALTVVPTVIRNAAHVTTPEAVVSNEGAWQEGNNTYRVMDKDGDYTDYTITITLQGQAPAPVIATQPAGVAYCAGSEPTLEVVATGDELHYAWFKEAGETDEAVGTDADSYTVEAAGTYYVIVTNHVDGRLDASVTSANAVVTLNVAAAITKQPVNKRDIVSGASVTLSVEATNATGYQWYICDDAEKANASAISGADAANYVFNCSANAFYYCVVGNACGADIESNVVSVKLEPVGCNVLDGTIPSEAPYIYDNGEWTLYAVTSGGKLDGTSRFDDDAKDFDGNTVNAITYGRVGMTFAKDVESLTIYATSSSSDRAISSIKVTTDDVTTGTPSYSDVTFTASAEKLGKKDSSSPYRFVLEANNMLLEAGKKYWLQFSGTVSAFKICYSEALAMPVLPTLSNQELCAGAAYETFNATITNAAACEGTVSYKWYSTNDTENPVAETAEFTPTAEGTYYVVVTHVKAGHISRVAQSANLTVAHFDALTLVSNSGDVFQHMGTAATLSVVATGKNVAYVWYTCSNAAGDDAVAITPAETESSLAIASVAEGVQYYKVVISHDCDATTLSHVFKVEGWNQLEQVDVTASTVWDMTNVSASEINLASMTPSKQNERLLLANIDGVNNNASFNSQALMFEGQRIGRTDNNVKHVSGQYVQFNVTVPGMVSVTFASNGDAQRTIQINGKECSRTTTSSDYIRYDVAVEPGSVEIEDVQGYVRISKIEFKAGDNYHRTVNPAYLGTLCWKNNAILGGATLYEFAGKNEYNYLVFDEVAENRLEAGKPYIFMPENGNTLIKVYNTDNEPAKTESDLQPVNHMYGTITGKTLVPGEDNNMYYFSASHIWAVKDFVVNIDVPAYYCYVDYEGVLNDEPAPAPAHGRRRVTMGVQGQQVATGIEDVQGDKVQCTKMLINGQLFILRGEKMYDAKGQLVK